MENMVTRKIDPLFWKNKKVFLTGHTGFKGGWLSLWLQNMGVDLCGYALQPNTTPNLFAEAKIAHHMQSIIGDIRDLSHLKKTLYDFAPDIVIHMAAQPLVRNSYQYPIETYTTNVLGTVHLFEAIRSIDSVKAIVNITTDKCYENREWLWGYRETEALGGHDPYSSSKACAEIVTSAYRRSFFEKNGIGLASARAGNVIGGGDWAKDRLIPDIIRSCQKQKNVLIRHPTAIRPWQHVLEPLSGYLMLAESLYKNPAAFSEAWNFGPADNDAKPVEWITEYILQKYDNGTKILPDNNPTPHEAHYLKLDCSKAKTLLGWHSKWTLEYALQNIVSWYKSHEQQMDAYSLTLNQIKEYISN